MQQSSDQGRALIAPDLPCSARGGSARTLPSGRVAVSCVPDGSWTLVSVSGELDLVTGDQIRAQLYDALAASTSGIELDLSGLSFCDCAGLSVFLELRHLALPQGKTVAIRTADPAFDRLLHLIGAHELFPRSESRCPEPHAHRPPTSPKLMSLS